MEINILIGMWRGVINEIHAIENEEEAKIQHNKMKIEYEISDNEEERESDENEVKWYKEVLK
jgi:hypothetical protein